MRLSQSALCVALMLSLVVQQGFAAEPSKEANEVVGANNQFAMDLYRQLGKEKENQGKNLFFSPYSMSNALMMTAEGARGETAAQMGKVLCFPAAARRHTAPDMAPLHAGMASLNQRFTAKPAAPGLREKIAALQRQLADANGRVKSLQDAGKWDVSMQESNKAAALARQLNPLLARVDQYELRVANALWGEKTYPFCPTYLETIRKYYRTGGVFPVDFLGNPDAARLKINAWVEEQTAKRIKNLIPEGAVTQATRLVLTNAIYFKGEWSEPFEPGATKDEPFALADGKTVRTPMMRKDGLEGARYAAINADGTAFPTPQMISIDRPADPKTLYPGKGGLLIAELPYKGGDLSMVVIVPQDAAGLPRLEQNLNAENLLAWLAKLEKRKLNVQLPKFKLETSYDMNSTLKTLGMVRAFIEPGRPNGAQFGGMSVSGEKLYISQVLHKAFVEVNEKGTEAAAATAVLMAGVSAPITMPFTPTFRADKPLVFLIRDIKTGTILFLGRVTQPKG